jgi:Glycosyl transferases group 1
VFALGGKGPEREELEEMATRLGIADRVRFLGRREDVPELLAACDVFALPSLYEGSSLAVLEAMAAGRPVVSSAIGGTDELIEDGRSGLLVAPGDAEALAAALRRLLADSGLRERLAGRARERVERDLTRQAMAERVAAVYAELLGDTGEEPADGGRLPESRRNRVLRRRDWRFALPDAELAASWRVPRPGGIGRARRRAEAAGLADVRAYWAGPLPHRLPQFWLPLDLPAAVSHLLAERQSGSPWGRALQLLWNLARKAGLLAPIYVVGSRSGETRDPELRIDPRAPLLLLTGGHRSINKVVALAFEHESQTPAGALKFARVPEAEPGLEREAEVLRRLGEERPDLAGMPRLRGAGRRDGRFAVSEDAVEGRPLLDDLCPENFEEIAMRVTRLLIELAEAEPAADPGWRQRLLAEPLAWLESAFGQALAPGAASSARDLLAGIGELALVPEHRDCSPWNILLAATGEPVLLDWESAEPDGLPGMDLVYFLANCAFVLDGAIESGRTRESYARLLDPTTPNGRVAAGAIEEYCSALDIGAEDFHRLRLLCWIVHSRSDYLHLELESPRGPSPEALRTAPFLGLLEEELGRDQP